LVLWFPAPNSYTGEDCAELHLHGGIGVVDSVTTALLRFGLRLAKPGEFTRRAFENGKLDLSQAEAVADLVDAETGAQSAQALGQLQGRLGARYEAWRENLVESLARLEAAVDFPDEEVPAEVAETARASLERLASDLEFALTDSRRGRRVREGYRVAVIGAPNAGKSSLINALSGRDVSIVTALPGTTRDVIETPLSIAGYQVLLADTAGLRATKDIIEIEGVRRARAWAEAADLRIWVVDTSAGDDEWRAVEDLVRPGDICVLNKADLGAGPDAGAAASAAARHGATPLSVSIVNQGAGTVETSLTERVLKDLSGAEFPVATRERHSAVLSEARDHLRRALEQLTAPELAAEDARLASRALAQITGRVNAEDILGRVFSTFCIGK
jgi:tRNA modification GTPase